jgi:hydrogenase nickel insertion protein HypA
VANIRRARGTGNIYLHTGSTNACQPKHEIVMHEVALVRAIVEVVEKQATAHKVRRIKSVTIRFNALTSHSADHVRFSFDIVKQDRPLLAGAKLKLNEVEPMLRCKCGNEFHGHHLPDVCPKCGALEVTAVNPTDMVLEGFEFDC